MVKKLFRVQHYYYCCYYNERNFISKLGPGYSSIKGRNSLPLVKSYSTQDNTSDSNFSSRGDGAKFPVWQSLGFTAVCGAGLLYYFKKEKDRIEENRRMEVAGSVGTPKLGGPIQLTDHNGQPFDSNAIKDKFLLVYFGFTHCPDVCPEELDKMSKIIELVDSTGTVVDHSSYDDPLVFLGNSNVGTKLLPVFVTVDPDRDGPNEIKEYLKDFHPSFVGLTGSKEEIKTTARKYRIYFRPARTLGNHSSSIPDKNNDYLIDHSIFFFLIDPTGQYVTHFGRESSPERCTKIILDALTSWDISK